MSLVQGDIVAGLDVADEFQYIICRWFNILVPSPNQPFAEFQYIICRWFKR